jgi:hypothetical protein
MKLFDEGVCEICGKSGFHPECEDRAIRAALEAKEIDLNFTKQYAISRTLGTVNHQDYTEAKAALDFHLGWVSTPEQDEVIASKDWFFFPVGWIGVIGHIVEKQTKHVFPLGSGLYNPDSNAPVKWDAIHAYLEGKLEPTSGNKKCQ